MAYSAASTRSLAGSPWQNGYAERLIGTLRRECLDQMVIFSEMLIVTLTSGMGSHGEL